MMDLQSIVRETEAQIEVLKQELENSRDAPYTRQALAESIAFLEQLIIEVAPSEAESGHSKVKASLTARERTSESSQEKPKPN